MSSVEFMLQLRLCSFMRASDLEKNFLGLNIEIESIIISLVNKLSIGQLSSPVRQGFNIQKKQKGNKTIFIVRCIMVF